MYLGLLWNDDDPQSTLHDKVARAVTHFRARYGATPTVCIVNPELLPHGPQIVAGVRLRSAPAVMINQFWIGVGDVSAFFERFPR
jgi:hypothetical protein